MKELNKALKKLATLENYLVDAQDFAYEVKRLIADALTEIDDTKNKKLGHKKLGRPKKS